MSQDFDVTTGTAAGAFGDTDKLGIAQSGAWKAGTPLQMATYARTKTTGNLNISDTGTLGFVTGAGGAISQGTSRTTTVIVNKSAGAITMFSAAGSATWATFTVTNSAVAATDTILLSVKSATNLYMLSVTAVAAGSFNISFATTGGTATDAPVINFAVIKAVAA